MVTTNEFENLAKIYDDNLLSNNNKNNLPKKIILTTIDDVFYCSICCYTIKSIGKVQLHIENKNHQQSKIFSASKKYLKPQFIPREDVELLEDTTEFPPEIFQNHTGGVQLVVAVYFVRQLTKVSLKFLAIIMKRKLK